MKCRRKDSLYPVRSMALLNSNYEKVCNQTYTSVTQLKLKAFKAKPKYDKTNKNHSVNERERTMYRICVNVNLSTFSYN